LTRVFARDLAAASIPERDERNRVVDIHALRVTFGTHLCAAGVPLRAAQAAMRHSKPELTANNYTTPSGSTLRELSTCCPRSNSHRKPIAHGGPAVRPRPDPSWRTACTATSTAQ
jgi:site-specific recombinase XerD